MWRDFWGLWGSEFSQARQTHTHTQQGALGKNWAMFDMLLLFKCKSKYCRVPNLYPSNFAALVSFTFEWMNEWMNERMSDITIHLVWFTRGLSCTVSGREITVQAKLNYMVYISPYWSYLEVQSVVNWCRLLFVINNTPCYDLEQICLEYIEYCGSFLRVWTVKSFIFSHWRTELNVKIICLLWDATDPV